MGRVLWINGCFSTGKTTVARLIVESIGNAFLLDPEVIGAVLRDRLVPPSLYPGDYLDLVFGERSRGRPSWTRRSASTAS